MSRLKIYLDRTTFCAVMSAIPPQHRFTDTEISEHNVSTLEPIIFIAGKPPASPEPSPPFDAETYKAHQYDEIGEDDDGTI